MSSFSDKLKELSTNNTLTASVESDIAVMSLEAAPAVMTLASEDELIAAYESWKKPENSARYIYYDDEYYDDKVSTVDGEKNITLASGQINITQEKNSQYIPFQIPRRYDGFDLANTDLSIYWVNETGAGSTAIPVDVYYSTDMIKFAWLIDQNVTAIAGKLKFEIHADGTNSKGFGYTWKTKPCNGLNVLQALEIKTFIEPDETWQETFIDKLSAQADRAEQASADAVDAAKEVKRLVTELQDGIADEVQEVVSTNYYTRQQTQEYVKTQIETVDVSGQLVKYALKSEIPTVPTNVSAFTNDAGYLTEHQDISGKSDVGHKHSMSDITDYEEPNLSDYALKEEIPSLEGYATETFVKDEIAKVDVSDQLVDYAKSADVYTKEETYSKTETDALLEAIDVTEQLADYAKSADVYTKEETEVLIEEIDVSDQVYTKEQSDEKYAVKSVETTLDTVRQNTITNAADILEAQKEIDVIQATLESFEGDNKNLIVQYEEVGSVLHLYERSENGDITITDGDEQVKVREIYSTIITGAGGGGTALVSTIKLSLRPAENDSYTVLFGSDTSLKYNLSTKKARETQDEDGNDVTVYEEAVIPGDITLTLYRNNVYVTHFTVTKTSSEVQSDVVDISDYIGLGNQVFTLTATYVENLGSDGESITIRSSADWAVNAVNLKITNLPDSTWEATPKYGSTTFSYTPIGALEKTIYFKIDNGEPDTVVTSLNGTALEYIIPQQTHGVHTLQVWCEGNVGGTIISTEPVNYVLMFVEEGNNSPIIRIKAPTTLEQYSSVDIYYNVFDPLNAIIDSVTIYDEDGVILSSVENITSAEQKWVFRPSVAKDKTITIKYKETTASVAIKVAQFPYEINAVTGDLMVDFVPTGRTNSDTDYNVFKNNAFTVKKDSVTGEETKEEIPVTWTFSENFDWINGGWKTDENGDTYFCIKSGTSVDINYNLFGTDGVVAKKDANGDYTIAGTGKEFKLVFKTTNVAQADATWLKCVDIADKKNLGIRMETQNAYIDSGLGTLEIPYVDDDVIEFDMNIIPMTKFLENGEPNLKVKTIPMILTYEDGTPVQPKVITSASTSFKQDTPQPISIGSEYCDVHIYRMKVYERYLEDKEIITNFIADARSGVEMAKRYVKNDIYPVEDKQKITPESVAASCPDLKVYILSAPYFTNDKGNKVENTTIKQIHNTGTKEKPEYDMYENWTAINAIHNGQGTSSNEYGYSGRNLEFNLKKATITLNDNVTVVKNIQLSPTSYPTNYLNFKINIASSENANNALLQKRYDRYLPYTSLASLLDDRKKNSMEFFNCVVFIQETDKDISTHREFADTDIHFYGIGNIGDSKKTDNSRVNDENDPNEFCVEIMDWNRYLSSFPTDTMLPTLYTDDDDTQVLRFEDFLVDKNLGEDGILFEKDAQGNYYHSTDTTVDKTKTYYIDILENDDFSEDYTYGFRYIQNEWKKDDDPDYKAKNEAFQKPLRQKWIEFYRFVTRDLTTNGVEDANKVAAWKSEFSDWFIQESALYYYLYTLRYTMVDSRAKNTFWHWGKHYITFDEAKELGIAVYDENKNLITDSANLPSRFYDANGNEIKNINAEAAAINNGYRMDFWAYDNDTALGIDNAGKLEIPYGVEEEDTDAAGVPYFRAHDSLVFVRIAKYFTEELENVWYNTENNSIGKVFDATGFINEFDTWQNEFPEELWRLDYERKYKRTYVGGTGTEWDNALPQSNKSDIVSTRFLTEMMNGRKKYQRRCFERNQEIYMSSKFKGEVNLGDTITLRGTGKPTGKVITPNFTLNLVPFSKMYVNLYSATDKIYYHKKCEAGVPCEPIPYPETTLDFIYIRGASQIQSLGDLSPMYLQTAELTSGAKLKEITLGNATTGYSNDSLKTLQIGAGNKLLEELNIRNLSNLDSTTLPVSNIPSLKRVYAQGSNISEAVFANNGLLEEAYLPATITRLELRNLHYLNTISLEAYDNLLHLVVMNCSEAMNNRLLDIIKQSTDLKTLRATDINWTLEDTSLLNRLYNLIETPDAPEVMLTGYVFVKTLRQSELEKYNAVWSDLIVECEEYIETFPVTFVNYDGTVLDVQYVDKGSDAVDPVTSGRIPTPTKPSSVSTNFTFAGWDVGFTDIYNSRTITATYSESVRMYTIQYVVEGVVKQTSVGEYGTTVPYTGEIPVRADGTHMFFLFDHWDKSGVVDGDKTINAVFDSCTYSDNYFEGRDISELRPVEIKMLMGMNMEQKYVESMDAISFNMGHDFDYEDVTSKEIISSTMTFNGTNYYDTGIAIMDIDRDFVLAIDYEFGSGNATDATLMHCFSEGTSDGFKLQYNATSSTAQIKWRNESSYQCANGTNREMLVIRHKAGEKDLYVYASNLAGDDVATTTLSATVRIPITSSTLVFGGAKFSNSSFKNYCIGSVHWAKVWYADLGDGVCKELAEYIHEPIHAEMCGFERNFLSSDLSQTSSMSFLTSHIINRKMVMNNSSSNTGGWAAASLNIWLNNRFYKGLPLGIKQLIKQVQIKSSIGDKSTTIMESDCYIYIPAIRDLDDSKTGEPYGSETYSTIDYMVDDLIRYDSSGITASDYWTRSPNASGTASQGYFYYVDATGKVSGYGTANTSRGIVVEFSI